MTQFSDIRAHVLREHVVIRLPLLMPFRGLTERESVLFRGPAGWGEFAPFDDYSPVFAARWLESGIEAAFAGWPSVTAPAIRVNAIIPSVPLVDLSAHVRIAVERDGCATIKIKVNGDEQDIDRVRIVRETLTACGVQGAIRVDANGAWSPDRAREVMDAIQPWGVEYVEQPCASLDDCEAVRGRASVPVFVDESVRQAESPRRPNVDGVIGKVGPLGGVRATVALAREWGLPMTVSSALDSSVGLAAGVAAAAHFPDRAHGLGTGRLFAEDVVSDPLVPRSGVIQVGGVTPEHDLLERAAARVSADRRAWWKQRLEHSFAVLGARPHERLGE